MTGNLIPTPVVDKNGRLTTVHKRAVRNSNGGKFPDPRNQPKYELGEFAKLISTDNHSEAMIKFALIDKDVISKTLALSRESRQWLITVSRVLNLIIMARKKPSYIEARMRHMLAVAPLANDANLMEQRRMEKVLNTAFFMQEQFPEISGKESVESWDADSDTKAVGCMIALSSYVQEPIAANAGAGMITEDDALWLGSHSAELIPLIPQLAARRIYTRADIEPLLESAAPALTEGIL